MNTVLMYVILCLVCRFKAPGGGFRNLKFEPQISDRLGISPKLIRLTLPLTKESLFPKEQSLWFDLA